MAGQVLTSERHAMSSQYTVLICTIPGDLHARAVEWSLASRNVHVDYWVNSDFPALESCSLGIRSGGHVEVSRRRTAEAVSSTVRPDAFWRRRFGKRIISDLIAPSDRAVAAEESKEVFAGLSYLVDSSKSFCVNPYLAGIRSRNKVEQLRVASTVGLSIPQTLISNNPDDVASFYRTCSSRLIIKSFTSPSWLGERSSYCSFTSIVEPTLLDDVEAISACPAIYQEQIDKEFEVRSLFIGAEHLSVLLDSQRTKRGRTDWREEGARNIPMLPHKLPENVAEKSRALMRELGIVTGSIDFVVRPNGEYVFLEINEMGQFLWMEQHCPQLPVLEAFTDFLCEGNPEYRWKRTPDASRSLLSFMRSGQLQAAFEAETSRHAKYDIAAESLIPELS